MPRTFNLKKNNYILNQRFTETQLITYVFLLQAAPVTSSTTSQEKMHLDQLFQVLEDSISRGQAENDQSHLWKGENLNMGVCLIVFCNLSFLKSSNQQDHDEMHIISNLNN